ncbi:SIR2 family NAD-dependent protein deacylase [Piscinibacter terrae]|uniref:NAD-dependent protein deacylase n=1 Tax=Piscinibacter terrae TaxID=2496871 RepID=A0A3N7HVP5_9BURK|nr:Sir2 family NAD-dependent protein deacetylase [Albitalea terrae]RQP25051.1 NAD-dependent deacylase [Albitalea terrae]
MKKQTIVILSGAGVSAESGLSTYRDSNGLWKQHAWQDLASPEGWRKNPQAVLEFYNERRALAWQAQPNAAHRAIAALEQAYDVVVVTQNVDALHERGGSTQVIHLHGELAYARGTSPARRRRLLEDRPIALGDLCEDGTQLRPDIVWFGEDVPLIADAAEEVRRADRILVVGTSLSVYPAASLVGYAPRHAVKALVSLEVEGLPHGYRFLRGKATEMVPALVEQWLQEAR